MRSFGDPWGASVVLGEPLCLRGLDLHLSLLGFGLIHLPPAGALEEATLGVEGAFQKVRPKAQYGGNEQIITEMGQQLPCNQETMKKCAGRDSGLFGVCRNAAAIVSLTFHRITMIIPSRRIPATTAEMMIHSGSSYGASTLSSGSISTANYGKRGRERSKVLVLIVLISTVTALPLRRGDHSP